MRAAPKPPRVYTAAERVLLPVALLVAVLFDRLLVTQLLTTGTNIPFFSAVFWLAFLVIYYAVYWNRLKGNRALWLVGALAGALCAWSFLFDYRTEYGLLSCLVLPAVLMAHTQLLAGGYTLKEVGKIAQAWLLGWIIKPFTGISAFSGAAGSVFSGGKKSQIKRVLIGVGIALPLLLVIVPLLGSADRVFAFYLEQLLYDFRISSFLGHLVVVAIALTLFYSFLWNIGFGDKTEAQQTTAAKPLQIDTLISCIVMGAIVAVYLLFCSVQFTYLFARAGLPGGMTYSEYAREGFSQMVTVCALNLLIFGVFLHYGRRHRVLTALLTALLILTGVMLVSSFVRLNLYIDTYGLTWLRMLSGWFIIYLAAVLVLCGARMLKASLPLIAVCSFLLLGWYVVLGYANPDAFIVRYNLRAAHSHSEWLEENHSYASSLSDNAMIALLDSDVDAGEVAVIVQTQERRREGYSLSSRVLQGRLEGERDPAQ